MRSISFHFAAISQFLLRLIRSLHAIHSHAFYSPCIMAAQYKACHRHETVSGSMCRLVDDNVLATVEKALAVARANGDNHLQRQVEDWIALRHTVPVAGEPNGCSA
jgi:hypothetical protein